MRLGNWTLFPLLSGHVSCSFNSTLWDNSYKRTINYITSVKILVSREIGDGSLMFRVACHDSHASNHVDSQNIWTTRRLRRSVRNQVRMRATHGLLRMHLLNQPSRWSVTRRAALQPDVVFSSITIFHPLLGLLLLSLSPSLLRYITFLRNRKSLVFCIG